MLGGLVVAVAGIATAAAILTQTVPGQSFPGSKISGPTTLSYDAADSGNNSTTHTAWLVFSGGSQPAFKVQTAGSYTPTFGSGSGESDVYIITSASGGSAAGSATSACNQFTGAHLLTTGSAVPGFAAGSMWDYCMDGVPGGSLSSFTISWN